MIKGAIFDADGTLLDSMKMWEDTGTRYLIKLGKTAAPDLNSILFTMTLEEGSAYLKKQYDLGVTPDEIKNGILGAITDYYRYEVRLKPGAQLFLHNLFLKNVPMVIATTGDKELLEMALKRLNIHNYFKQIFTCTELNTSKKESFIYRKAATYMNIDPEIIFVFEDVLHAILSASSAGFRTVAVEDESSKNYKNEIKHCADYYMTDFHDFDSFWKYASRI